MPYQVMQSMVGDQFDYRAGDIVDWADAEDAARLVAAGVLAPLPENSDPENPESTRAKSRKKETR